MANTLELLNATRASYRDNLPTATLYQTSPQSITSSTITPVQFGAATGDNWAGWSSGSNTRYTVQVAGVYLVTGLVLFNLTTGSGVIISLLEKNGTELTPCQNQLPVVATGTQSIITPPMVVTATVGDYFQLGAYQTTGGAQNTYASGMMASYMTVVWLRNQ